MLRRTRSLLVAPFVLVPLLLSPGMAEAAPATPAEMSLYTRMAAINVCIASSNGVEFQKAVSIAAETTALVLQGQHQSLIQQVGSKALTIEELRRGSANSAVIGAVEICPKQVPADVKAKVDAAIKQARAKQPAGKK